VESVKRRGDHRLAVASLWCLEASQNGRWELVVIVVQFPTVSLGNVTIVTFLQQWNSHILPTLTQGIMTEFNAKKDCELVVRRLRSLRLQKGLSHEALAKRAGISRAAVSHIENGKRNPSLMICLKLTYALESDLRNLLK
jgi:putative transcriptional regulator